MSASLPGTSGVSSSAARTRRAKACLEGFWKVLVQPTLTCLSWLNMSQNRVEPRIITELPGKNWPLGGCKLKIAEVCKKKCFNVSTQCCPYWRRNPVFEFFVIWRQFLIFSPVPSWSSMPSSDRIGCWVSRLLQGTIGRDRHLAAWGAQIVWTSIDAIWLV